MNRHLKARICFMDGTQEDFAARCGLNSTHVSKVVRGRRELSESEKKRWAGFLKCRTEEIFPDGSNGG